MRSSPVWRWSGSPLGSPALAAILVTGLFVFGMALPSVQLFKSSEAYLPVHTLLEFIAISISVMIFTLGWNVRNEQEANHFPILGGAFFAVALVDLVHTLSYAGMPALITPNSPEKSLNFWLAARFVATATLLALALLPAHQKLSRYFAHTGFLLGLLVTTAILYIGLYHATQLPRTFIPGHGLTPLTLTVEYVLVVMCAVSTWLFARRAKDEDSASLAWLAAATWTLGLAELFFIRYQIFTDQINLFGHLFKAMGYLMICRALFIASMRRSYSWPSEDNTKIELALQESRIAACAFEVQEGVMITDANNVILRVNKSFTKLTGYSPQDVVGKTPSILKSDHHDPRFFQAMWQTLLHEHYWAGEVWDKRKDGTIYPKWLTINVITNTAGEITNYVATFSDISHAKEAKENIRRLAFYDPLTDLPNRRLLLDRLEQAIIRSGRSRHHGAILFIDLDNFKALNDTKGHNFGDLMLIEVAFRLQGCLREKDTMARLGGDEFVVLLEDLSKTTAQAAAQAKLVAEKILDAINQPYSLQGHKYHSSTSIGISMFCNNEIAADKLLGHADTAMHQSKQAGRNMLHFFDLSMQAALEARATLEADLRQALSQQQFKLLYQMQVDSNRRILGAEVLLHWEHPERGLVPPMQFIPLAEETGLIMPIGHFVLETACKQLKAWEGKLHTRNLSLAVNVSTRQFRQADFIEQVRTILEQTGANPNLLKLELTESLIIDDIAGTIEKMQTLKSFEVGFSMDDFGTGYSSLASLKRLPLDQLKIDQSFVRDIAIDPNDAAIVKTIIGMANTLELDVIAEGVETEEQLKLLKQYECFSYQGYLFGKPVPLKEFERLLKNSQANQNKT